MNLHDKAAAAGILTHYTDALGQLRTPADSVLERLLEVLGPTDHEEPERIDLKEAWQGDFDRGWLLAIQLYSVRSESNWGIGDFGDLERLIRIAAGAGAAGVGLNPLHALFDGADDISPYQPNSRLYLNTIYIDLERVPELEPSVRQSLDAEIAECRRTPLIDYAHVRAIKSRSLDVAFAAFSTRRGGERQSALAHFIQLGGDRLKRFCVFEILRKRLNGAWWDWPDGWHAPSAESVERFFETENDCRRIAYEQWLAHEQLHACTALAHELGMAVGLYLDIAVGVRPDGFDAWCEQDALLKDFAVGAPPDLLNVAGQNWGLAGFNPAGLARTGYRAFRDMLDASMKYSGAVRIDHILGLQRLYLVPAGYAPDQGSYVQMPLDHLLAELSDRSRENRCIVIGEDLGTVPEGFREKLAQWGIWSYRVLMFERDAEGQFHPPETYSPNSLATFGTHDLPTFSGWLTGADWHMRQKLALPTNESADERAAAVHALNTALGGSEFSDLVQFLSRAGSRLISWSLEDVLGTSLQVNVPGTVTEHANWRLPLSLSESELKSLLLPIVKYGRRGM